MVERTRRGTPETLWWGKSVLNTISQNAIFYFLTEAGTTPNTTNFCILFKLIQQSNMVILSCLAKKNQNLNARKKSSVYYWKLRFQGRNAHEPPFSGINWIFFPRNKNFDFFFQALKILIFFPRIKNFDFSSRGNSEYHIRLLYKLENNQKKMLVLGVVDMHQFLLKQIKAKRQIS